ncbi:MAG: outer membrane protein assembly factor BamE [Gammaproteobacteria bacterium]|jgi:outer membrane protein assembly factor BamE
MIQKLTIALLAAATLITSACSVYRLDTRQGNALDKEAVEEVAIGMTRNDVHNILGSPSVSDPFHQNREDYVYYFRKEGHGDKDSSRVTVFYSEGVVAKIDRDLAE